VILKLHEPLLTEHLGLPGLHPLVPTAFPALQFAIVKSVPLEMERCGAVVSCVFAVVLVLQLGESSAALEK